MASVYKSLSKSAGPKAESTSDGPKRNKQRVLVLSSRGITYRHRHLMNDLAAMLPHGKRDVKFDSKSKLYQLNELAHLYNCNNVLFFEARKGKDLYLWLSKIPNGPSVKFYVQNIHTMEELHFTGNCLKGSRPVLSFDSTFENEPHLKVIKQLFLHVFGVPQGARKSKPFVDHVMGFSVADGKIWVRNYQITETEKTGKADEDGEETSKPRTSKGGGSKDTEVSLVEIGPRMVLTPILIQEGAFGGPIIYENREYVSANQVRSDLRRAQAGRHNARAEKNVERLAKKGDLGLRSDVPRIGAGDQLDSRKLFA